MFEPVASDVSFPKMELELLEFWRTEAVFQRSVEQCRNRPRFTFYEGPPTANGIPHWGHILTRVAKDVFLRYKSMTGFYVPRRSGWDTHGLPVEIEVERQLGIHGRQEVERMGLDAFTRRCIESVWRYIDEWERMSERVGFWLDRDGYATYHRYYVESVWWALSELFKKGLLYQGYKSVWWWPQGGTALSQGEVGEGYRTIDDISIIVGFQVADREKTYLLAWTTTPWTLPSNLALAVAAEETYVEVELRGERLILAEALLESVLGKFDYEIERRFPGSELEGTRYEPLYNFREPEEGRAWEVGCADFVTLDTGTGIVHIAPGFGEDDFQFGKQNGFGFLQLVEPDGTFGADAGEFAGLYIKDADPLIIEDLKKRGLLLSKESYRHEYPFCPRAPDDPLIQYARRSWFIRTSGEKERVLANNAEVRWQPAHIRDGRMGDFLRNNVDWAISRERWWGTPLPIWVNDETGRMEAIASADEILERNPSAFDAFHEAKRNDPDLDENLMVHRPWIDHVTWTREGEPGVYRRVPEVIDCWFDAGSMPFAQWGYPHRNRDEFEEAFPADFITEAIDQTRGWWNGLLQISTLLFEEAERPHPFRSCVVLGLITDRDGRKLSKRLRNYEPPLDAFEHYSADAVRWALLVGNVPGLGTRFDGEYATQATRDLLLKVWNVYSFFVTYARIDGWDPREERPAERSRHTLDRWVLAELDRTVRGVREAYDALESHTAARRIQAFVDGLSNWYVRRSRPRFWAEGDSDDKHAAFSTLYEVLTELARLLAPFTPFLAEALHQRLVRPADPAAPVSVHLTDYPEATGARCDDELCRSMGLARDVVALGLQVRAAHRLKVRQPLAEAILVLAHDEKLDRFQDAIREELNVKSLRVTDDPHTYVDFTIVPNFRALGPRLGKRMPLVKKALAEADGAALYAALEESGSFELPLPEGEPLRLTREEVEIRLTEREGYAAAGQGGRVVVLDERVTDELRREGLAREVVNRVQNARKALDLPYEARIEVRYESAGDLAEAVAEHREWIMSETLATRLEPGEPSGEAHEADIEGTAFRFSITRN
jgi:isoleucyl-tRNA synthetase